VFPKNLVLSYVNLADEISERRTAITVEELAEILTCSKKALYKMIQRGSLPHLRFGSMIRLDPDVTSEWLRACGIGKLVR
jgi:excisionase family DNA binding protein